MVRGSLLESFIAWAIAWALASAGCHRGGGDDGPPCSVVATRFLDLATHDLSQAQVDDLDRRAVADQLPAIRDALVQACVERRWSAAVRTCLVQAGDHVAFETCERQLTDEQRRDLDRANRGPSAPAP